MAPCSSVAFVDDADGNGIITGHALTTSRMPARAAAADASHDRLPAPTPQASRETPQSEGPPSTASLSSRTGSRRLLRHAPIGGAAVRGSWHPTPGAT